MPNLKTKINYEYERRRRAIISCKDITFKELYKEYDTFIKVHHKAQSYRKEKSMFEIHLVPYFGDLLLKDINFEKYTKWQYMIENEYNYAIATKRNLHNAMSGIFTYAVKAKYTDSNIPQLVGNFNKRNGIVNQKAIWTIEEYNAFISVVNNLEEKTLFNLLYFTGMRIGECLALTWEDFDGTYLNINKTKAKEKDKNGNYIINSPKCEKSARKIPLCRLSIDLLNELKKIESKNVHFNNKNFIFNIAETTLTRHKNEYCIKANVKKIRLHDFRHSFATLLLSKNVPIYIVSQLLGHSDIVTTLKYYIHFLPRDNAVVLNVLDKINN